MAGYVSGGEWSLKSWEPGLLSLIQGQNSRDSTMTWSIHTDPFCVYIKLSLIFIPFGGSHPAKSGSFINCSSSSFSFSVVTMSANDGPIACFAGRRCCSCLRAFERGGLIASVTFSVFAVTEVALVRVEDLTDSSLHSVDNGLCTAGDLSPRIEESHGCAGSFLFGSSSKLGGLTPGVISSVGDCVSSWACTAILVLNDGIVADESSFLFSDTPVTSIGSDGWLNRCCELSSEMVAGFSLQ